MLEGVSGVGELDFSETGVVAVAPSLIIGTVRWAALTYQPCIIHTDTDTHRRQGGGRERDEGVQRWLVIVHYTEVQF